MPLNLASCSTMRRFHSYAVLLALLMLVWLIVWSLSPDNSCDMDPLPRSIRASDPSCGEICGYDGVPRPGRFYPYIEKGVSCQNILARMRNAPSGGIYPPPKCPPKEMYNDFTQNGECPIIGSYYLIDFKPRGTTVKKFVPEEHIEVLLAKDRNGENINVYTDSYLCRKSLHRYKQSINAGRGIVIGTTEPWLEAMLINLNASHVTTSEYNPLYLGHPKMRVGHPKDIAEHFLSGQVEPFDFAASFSSIEHSGLGRYGDPLDPFGDLEAVSQVWCMIKPGGTFFLGLPMNRDKKTCAIQWNAHRLYGVSRLQHLTANWEVVDILSHNTQEEKSDPHSVLILRKPL